MSDVKEYWFCFLELKESISSWVVNFISEIFGSLLDFADFVAFVSVEHEAGGADHAEWNAGYQ